MPSTQTTSYLVCATPRSGSSLLCGLLAGTGVAGRPEEYFWRGDEGSWSQRWGVSGFADYLRAAIAHGSTPNGVFGAKVMYGYLPDLLGSLVELPGGRGLDDRSLLERVFPNLCCLWIWREDVVAQAVSWSKALQTNVWSVGDERAPAATPPRFDFE
jgi:trehalose 2-sulfotransferase